jgi:formylglycine-generating enzyme required for sulfatase activity
MENKSMSDLHAISFEGSAEPEPSTAAGRAVDIHSIVDVYCPNGSFMMGKGFEHETFEHMVRIIRPIYMADTLVSQALWSRYCENGSNWRGARLPVERVSWLEAVIFCNMLSKAKGLQPSYTIKNGVISFDGIKNGYRLPFEVEWEYCARAGGLDYEFSGSDSYEDVCLKGVDRQFTSHTIPLRSAKANDWGLYDMTGNLNEWCNDLYNSDAYQARISPKKGGYEFDIVDQEFTLDLMSAREFSSFNAVVRGGSWFNSPAFSKVYSRHRFNIMYPSSMVGIRLVRNA